MGGDEAVLVEEVDDGADAREPSLLDPVRADDAHAPIALPLVRAELGLRVAHDDEVPSLGEELAKAGFVDRTEMLLGHEGPIAGIAKMNAGGGLHVRDLVRE